MRVGGWGGKRASGKADGTVPGPEQGTALTFVDMVGFWLPGGLDCQHGLLGELAALLDLWSHGDLDVLELGGNLWLGCRLRKHAVVVHPLDHVVSRLRFRRDL